LSDQPDDFSLPTYPSYGSINPINDSKLFTAPGTWSPIDITGSGVLSWLRIISENYANFYDFELLIMLDGNEFFNEDINDFKDFINPFYISTPVRFDYYSIPAQELHLGLIKSFPFYTSLKVTFTFGGAAGLTLKVKGSYNIVA